MCLYLDLLGHFSAGKDPVALKTAGDADLIYQYLQLA